MYLLTRNKYVVLTFLEIDMILKEIWEEWSYQKTSENICYESYEINASNIIISITKNVIKDETKKKLKLMRDHYDSGLFLKVYFCIIWVVCMLLTNFVFFRNT